MTVTTRYDEWFPFRGPCGICGGPDARHRIWDTIVGRYYGGDSEALLAREYDQPVEAIEALVSHWYVGEELS